MQAFPAHSVLCQGLQELLFTADVKPEHMDVEEIGPSVAVVLLSTFVSSLEQSDGSVKQQFRRF
jgi:hypothetical protein